MSMFMFASCWPDWPSGRLGVRVGGGCRDGGRKSLRRPWIASEFRLIIRPIGQRDLASSLPPPRQPSPCRIIRIPRRGGRPALCAGHDGYGPSL